VEYGTGVSQTFRLNEIGISVGVSELRPEEDAASLFQRAYEAMYRAKSAGGNRLSD
jgi:PleD family two-component response regulator